MKKQARPTYTVEFKLETVQLLIRTTLWKRRLKQ